MTMACGSCGGSRIRAGSFVWTSADGKETRTYSSELQAKAKVIRVGGEYKPRATA